MLSDEPFWRTNDAIPSKSHTDDVLACDGPGLDNVSDDHATVGSVLLALARKEESDDFTAGKVVIEREARPPWLISINSPITGRPLFSS
jgi:hypothetical protein